MPFVPRELFEVMTALVADLAAGRLVRASEPVAVPTIERTLALVPEMVKEPAPLSDEITQACRLFGRTKKALDANFAVARRMQSNGASDHDIVTAIAQGRPA